MNWSSANTVDFLLVLLGCLWFFSALLRGGKPFSSPLLWFFAGTLVFIHIGALRDAVLGKAYPPDLEWRFRAIEGLHLSCVCLGYWLASGRAPRALLGGRPQRSIGVGRLLVLAVAGLALKWMIAPPLDEAPATRSNYVLQFTLLAPAVGIAIWGWFLEWRRAYHGPALWVGLVCLVVGVGLGFEKSRTPPMYVFFVIVMTLLQGGYGGSRRAVPGLLLRWLRVYLVPLVLGVALVGGAALKGLSAYTRLGTIEQAQRSAKMHLETLGFIDAYENGMLTMAWVPKVYRYRRLESVGALLLGWIPRSAWPEKPTGFAHYFSIMKLGKEGAASGTSLAPSLLGDFWANGGVVSVVGLSLILGWAMGGLRAWGLAGAKRSVRFAALYWAAVFMFFLAPRGDSYVVFQRGLVLLLLVRLVYYLVSVRVTFVVAPRRPASA